MPPIRSDQPLVPSVLDRLLDDDPAVTTEPARNRSQLLRELKLSVRRDIESLLNARRRNVSIPPGLPELANSLLTYGIPDFSGTGPATDEQRTAFCRLLETILRQGEPRLLKVSVELVADPTPEDRTLRFRIDALLRADPSPEPVVFDSTLEPATHQFAGTNMTEDLLPYYNRELSYIRRHAGRFAEAHPKVAARLRLGPDGSEDPHVERLLQGFAYLTARVRHKLDDEFPEITQALIGALYPHYLAPIPSCAVVQLDLDPGQNELTAGLTVPRGQTLESEPIQGEPCRFRTAYPVSLYPVDVRLVSLASAPFTAPATPRSNTALAVLRVGLGTRSSNVRFADFAGMAKLRLFLRGQPQHTQRLYELLLNHAVEVAFAKRPDDKGAVAVGPEAIQPVGFARDEGLFPYPARSFTGYRLLTEYFTFPQKFMFVDVTVPPAALARTDGVLEMFVYLNRQAADLEPNVTADTLKLGCTPMVNLYEQPAEPIRLTQQQFEYRVVPDHRRPLAHEIYSIDRVTATAADGREAEYVPFFAVKHGSARNAGPYWHSTRRPAADRAEPKPETTAVDHGTEVYLSFVDIGFNPAAPIDWTVSVRATCMNRDLPARLPFGGGQPKLQLSDGSGLVTRITCLTPPTPTVRTHLREEGLWRLVSHLTLNHLSLTDGPDGADALREILALYDFTESAVTRAHIEGVRNVSGKRVLGRANGAVCRGVEVGVEFDEDRFTGNGMYLFASVLDRFFTLYASVNTFTRTVATVARREGVYKRFPARAGDQIVL